MKNEEKRKNAWGILELLQVHSNSETYPEMFTVFEAGEVAGSATCKQSKTVDNCFVL